MHSCPPRARNSRNATEQDRQQCAALLNSRAVAGIVLSKSKVSRATKSGCFLERAVSWSVRVPACTTRSAGCSKPLVLCCLLVPAAHSRILVEQHTPATSLIRGVVDILLDSWRHIDSQVRETDKALERIARASDVCRRLMTAPGVVTPDRFRLVGDIGPYLGLTPRKYQ